MLDTFTFADPHRTLELNPTEVDRLRAIAERVISGKVGRARAAAQPSEARAAQPQGADRRRVSFDCDGQRRRRRWSRSSRRIGPGCCTIWRRRSRASGGNIEVVLIDTQAHKAIDVFYVTAAGKKLTPRSSKNWPKR